MTALWFVQRWTQQIPNSKLKHNRLKHCAQSAPGFRAGIALPKCHTLNASVMLATNESGESGNCGVQQTDFDSRAGLFREKKARDVQTKLQISH